MPLLLASAICKNDENSHQEFMRKEINQLWCNQSVSYLIFSCQNNDLPLSHIQSSID